jgi:hypothetical protein
MSTLHTVLSSSITEEERCYVQGDQKSLCTDDYNTYVRNTETFWSPWIYQLFWQLFNLYVGPSYSFVVVNRRGGTVLRTEWSKSLCSPGDYNTCQVHRNFLIILYIPAVLAKFVTHTCKGLSAVRTESQRAKTIGFNLNLINRGQTWPADCSMHKIYTELIAQRLGTSGMGG